MAWILKQAEDILNRVDQQANAAINQHSVGSGTGSSSDERSNDSSSLSSRTTDNGNSINRSNYGGSRRSKKDQEADLLEYLNSATPTSKKITKSKPSNSQLTDANRTVSSPNMVNDDQTNVSTEQSLSKSASVTPRSTTPAATSQDEDQGLVLDIPSIEQVTQDSTLTRKVADSSMKDDVINSLHAEIQLLMRDKRNNEQDLQNYKRQQILYQQQISESDALLRDLRSRESDSLEALSAKDSQIALLRVRLAESDELAKSKTMLCEQLQNQCSRILQDHTDASGLQSQAFDSLQARLNQVEQDLQQRMHELDRITEEKKILERKSNEEKQQLVDQLKLAEKRLQDERNQYQEQQQQVKHNKTFIHQLEQDMQEYKAKAQRILQTKDKLIEKLKEMAQGRNNSIGSNESQDGDNIQTSEDGNIIDLHLVRGNSPSNGSTVGIHSSWSSVQYEELKSENELFKQELQAREFTINSLRSELQESEALVQHAEEQLREQTDQLNEQLKDERARLILAEQDYRKLKQEIAYLQDDFHRQKQVHLTQLNERERELERLRLQLTAKTINTVNDEELEKRLQTLTESLIHKQTIIEALQTEKSSLTMQLERLEKRLEDYERIATSNIANSTGSGTSSSVKRLQATTINMDMDGNNYDNDHDDSLRYRLSMLREKPYDPDITKKVKRAANEIDRLGIRIGIFLKRYPAVRLGVIVYAILLHLWTLIVLFTYKPEIHGNLHSPLDNPHNS